MHESTHHETRMLINDFWNHLSYLEESPPIIDRSEITGYQMWLYGPEFSVNYIDIEGSSPPITNHLSDVTYKINWGEGKLVTDSSEMQLQPGAEVTIFRGHKYKYSGEFDAVVEAKPGLSDKFVTFYDMKLGKKEARELKHLQNGHTGHMRAIAKMLNLALEAVELTQPRRTTISL